MSATMIRVPRAARTIAAHATGRRDRVTTTADSTFLAIDRAPFLAAVTGHPGATTAAEAQVTARSL